MSVVKKIVINMRETVDEINGLPILPIDDRSLSLHTCKILGIRTGLSCKDGKTPVAHYFPYYDKTTGKISGYKKRDITLPKDHGDHFSVIGTIKSDSTQLFGEPVCRGNGVKLVIVEGEYDVAAAYQSLWENQSPPGKYPPQVVGLPLGSNSAARSVAANIDFIKNYKELIIGFDNDDAGRKALSDVAAIIPGIKSAVYPNGYKDPCDMLKEGKSKELMDLLLWNSKEYVPAGFVRVEDVEYEATKMPEFGRPWPWPTLTKLTYGRRDGEGIYVGAGVKMGKSSFVDQMLKHIIEDEGRAAGVFKFEESPAMTVRKVAGKIMHKQFHIPDGDFTQAELIEGVSRTKGKLIMFDPFLSQERGLPWDRLKPAIAHAVVVEGVKDIFIDPITQLTDGLPADKTDTELRRFSNEIAAMAKDLGFYYYCFCHLKAPLAGKPHEEGGRVHSNQFRGSRAMMEKTHYLLGIERNKDPSLPDEERNMSKFVLLEDRVFGNNGMFDVYYNRETGDYLEPVYPDNY